MAESEKRAKFQHINPQFLVADAVAAAEFYRDKLGFEVEFTLGEPWTFAAVIRSGICIYLKQIDGPEPSRQFKAEGGHYDAYIFTTDVKALYQEYTDNGVIFLQPLETTDYGTTEFLIQDPYGYLIRFGQ